MAASQPAALELELHNNKYFSHSQATLETFPADKFDLMPVTTIKGEQKLVVVIVMGAMARPSSDGGHERMKRNVMK